MALSICSQSCHTSPTIRTQPFSFIYLVDSTETKADSLYIYPWVLSTVLGSSTGTVPVPLALVLFHSVLT